MIKNVITSKKDSVDGRITGTKYSRMDQVKFFTGCLSQILLGPFLNTLSQLWLSLQTIINNNLLFSFYFETPDGFALLKKSLKENLFFCTLIKCTYHFINQSGIFQ